jgi:hypothetical protein
MFRTCISGVRHIPLDVDLALAGQGLRPGVRVPDPVMDAAREAAREAGALLDARFVRSVASVERHERTPVVAGSVRLDTTAIAHELVGASCLASFVCTIGPALEARVSSVLPHDPVLALALDGLGSAACERLASSLCEELGREAAAQGLQVTGPLTPGMIGWALHPAQTAVFALVDPAPIGVRLTASGQMIPRKSVSFIVGIGAEVRPRTSACERCDAIRPGQT